MTLIIKFILILNTCKKNFICVFVTCICHFNNSFLRDLGTIQIVRVFRYFKLASFSYISTLIVMLVSVGKATLVIIVINIKKLKSKGRVIHEFEFVLTSRYTIGTYGFLQTSHYILSRLNM